jgi:hypothetical protein
MIKIESLESRMLLSAVPVQVLYVSARSGSDTNLGTQHYPLRTVQAAERFAHFGAPHKFIIKLEV